MMGKNDRVEWGEALASLILLLLVVRFPFLLC